MNVRQDFLLEIQVGWQTVIGDFRLRLQGYFFSQFGLLFVDSEKFPVHQLPKYYSLNGYRRTPNHYHFNYRLLQTMILENDAQEELIEKARKKICLSSIFSAARRVEAQKLNKLNKTPIEIQQEIDRFIEDNSTYERITTQFGDSSSIMKGAFNSPGNQFVTAGASSSGAVWKVPQSNEMTKLIGHTSKLHDAVFHPFSGKNLGANSPNIATASSDNDIRLWSLNPSIPIQKSIPLKGHKDRVNRVLFHPCGDYLLSGSYDQTWMFWDLTKASKLYTQSGHRQQVHTIAIHPDGSLFFSGDTRGNGMLWDLRTGKSLLPVQGHTSKILASDFSSNGFVLATGGEDNYIRIWDIRKKGQIYCIPAHSKLVSDLKFNQTGTILFSVSHDTTIRLWHGTLFSLVNNYKADESRISSIDVNSDFVATTNLDRKWNLWQRKQNIKMELEAFM